MGVPLNRPFFHVTFHEINHIFRATPVEKPISPQPQPVGAARAPPESEDVTVTYTSPANWRSCR